MALDGGRHGKRCNCKKCSQKSGNMHKNMVSAKPLNARLRTPRLHAAFKTAAHWPRNGCTLAEEL